MNTLGLVLLLLLAFLTTVCAAPEHDRIKHLPGLDHDPPFAMYSGYLDGGAHPTLGSLRIFYLAALASEVPPEKAPVITWNQGGPGCSSLAGMFLENGPFRMSASGELVGNQWAWNRRANMVWLEMPVGTGFSYATRGNYTFGDNESFAMNMAAMTDLFATKFPEWRHLDWYLAGESYAGHFLPGTLYWFLTHGASSSSATVKRPQGMLLGNPWTDSTIDGFSSVFWIYTHTLASLDSWLAVRKECHLDEAENDREHSSRDKLGKIKLRSIVGGDVMSPLQLLHGTEASCQQAILQLVAEPGHLVSQNDIYQPCTPGGSSGDCTLDSSPLTEYLNRPDVRAALHAHKVAWKWQICNVDAGVLNYNSAWESMVSIYPKLAEHYKLTIYSGDVTSSCGTLGTQQWIHGLGWNETVRWVNWMDAEHQVGGYVRKWKQLALVTVRGAGHMVPMFQPMRAYSMLLRFLDGSFQP